MLHARNVEKNKLNSTLSGQVCQSADKESDKSDAALPSLRGSQAGSMLKPLLRNQSQFTFTCFFACRIHAFRKYLDDMGDLDSF